jgi:membrane protein
LTVGEIVLLELLKKSAQDWQAVDAPRLSAALTYYALFSIAPLLVLLVAIAGALFGDRAVEGEIIGQAESWLGTAGAMAVQSLLVSVSLQGGSGTAVVLATLLTLYGASNLFNQLKLTLNAVWRTPPVEEPGWLNFIKNRALALGMVFGSGILLAGLLLISTAVTAIDQYVSQLIPELSNLVGAMRLIDILLSVLVTTIMFGIVYKLLPDIRLAWRDVWTGAFFTAVLFTLGKWALGFYLGYASPGSAYGAAGSLVALLVWLYYSLQIFLFGASFTAVYARERGSLRETTTADGQ